MKKQTGPKVAAAPAFSGENSGPAPALEDLGVATVHWDFENDTATLSASYREWLGYGTGPSSDPIEAWYDLVHPDDLATLLRKNSKKARRRALLKDAEFRIKDASGRYRWALNKGAATQSDRTGTPLRGLSIHLDITARKEAEQSFREEKTECRELFDNMASGVLVCTSEQKGKPFKVVNLNRAARKITGAPSASAGQSIFSVFPKVDACGILSAMENVNDTGEPINIPRCYYDDGVRKLWLNCYIYRLPSQKIVAMFNDISSDEHLKKKLNQQKTQLDQVVDQAADAFFLVSANLMILQLNQSAAKMTGYSREELIGQPFTILFSENELENGMAIIPSPGCGQPIMKERTWRTKNGDKISVELHGNTMPNGNYHGFVRDITERNKNQIALLQSQLDLKKKQKEIEETNIALRVLIKKAEEEKEELKERLTANTLCLVNPYIDKLKKSNLSHDQKKNIQIIESTLSNLISPFARTSMLKNVKLSQTELKVTNLIKQGKSTKEIADIMCVSPQTINKHRSNIRRKMGLKNRNTSISEGI